MDQFRHGLAPFLGRIVPCELTFLKDRDGARRPWAVSLGCKSLERFWARTHPLRPTGYFRRRVPPPSCPLSQTTLPLDPTLAEDVKDARHVAYSYVEDAFAEARQDGLDSDALAHAALFAAMRTLVETYGEEATAVFAEALPEKIRNGSFTIGTRH
jgi:hypothetical protein